MKLLTFLLSMTYLSVTAQVEFVERQPKNVKEFRYHIVSYVQLPNDSCEYKRIKIYAIAERSYYLGDYLQKTGRKFKTLIGNEVLGKENDNLTVTDRLLNNENYFKNN